MPEAERKYIAPLLRIDGEGVQIQKLSHHHLAIMDFMLANPTVPQWALAKQFNRTQAWVSTVVNSDLFQAHLHERRKLIEDAQRENINSRLFSLSEKGLSHLSDAMDDEGTSVAEKRAITRMSLEAQGVFNNSRTAAAHIVVNNNNTANAQAVNDDNKARINAARQRILQQSRNASLILSPDQDE